MLNSIIGKALACNYGLMALNISDSGPKERPMESVVLSSQMETHMKGNGSMIKHMDLENTTIQMERGMRVDGSKISKKAGARKLGLMAANIMVCISMVRSKAKVVSLGQMVPLTKGSGNVIRCMDTAFSNGQMDAVMRAGTSTTVSMGKVYSLIAMARRSHHNGVMENKRDMFKM